ncbi:MAG: DUF3820 family protein [Bacteroidia bacterium]|nr:DUF3820 family protein [Bacteroidia bacterium]
MENLTDPTILPDLVNKTMPFGRYKDTYYYQLPVSYLEWFARNGFPNGRVGVLLATVYEIKLNGLEYLLKELKKRST